MSIGAPILAVYSFLQNEGLLDGVQNVVELGSIEYEIKSEVGNQVFERFLKRAGAEVPQGINPENGFYKGWGRYFYEALGHQYHSLDIDGRFGSRVFDLNHDQAPDDLWQWSDLTTNLGTSEHVFNQLNSFRVAHDLTKPGGLMLHLLPMNNLLTHGIFQYSPSLFACTAEFNGYSLLGQWVSTPEPSFWLPASAHKRYLLLSQVIVTLMRRETDADFIIPLQTDTGIIVHDTALGRYNIDSFESHHRGLPVNDVGFKVDFETLESRRLSMEDILAEEELRILAEGGPDAPTVALRTARGELKRRDKVIARLQAAATKEDAPQGKPQKVG